MYVENGVNSIKGLGQMQGRQTGGGGSQPPPQILEGGGLNACQLANVPPPNLPH